TGAGSARMAAGRGYQSRQQSAIAVRGRMGAEREPGAADLQRDAAIPAIPSESAGGVARAVAGASSGDRRSLAHGLRAAWIAMLAWVRTIDRLLRHWGACDRLDCVEPFSYGFAQPI